MKAIVIHTHGGPDVLKFEDIQEPTAGPGKLLVHVAAAGVNFIDTYQREGLYEMPLPFTPGLEGSGTVAAIGEGVTGFAVGDGVAWAGNLGSYAEKVALAADKAVLVPAGADLTISAQAMLQGMTAHYLVTSLFEIKPGQTALVHAAAGGVGLLLCQMISTRGATVIGTVSTEAKAQAALAAGASHVIRYDQEDFVAKVRDLTEGVGVDVVYDGVGSATFEGSMRSLKIRGMLALFGQSSGPAGPINPQTLNQMGSLFLTRPTLAHYTQTPEELQWRAGEVLGGLANGTLNFALSGSYPLADAAQAHRDLEGRKTSGKLVLIP